MLLSYIIIDDSPESALKTKAVADNFSDLVYLSSANTYEEGLNLVLEHLPKIVFLEIDPSNSKSKLSLTFINELYQYLDVIPEIIITTTKKDLAFEALQYSVVDYLIKPIQSIDLVKSILKLNKLIKKTLNLNTEPAVFEHTSSDIEQKSLKVVSSSETQNSEHPLVLCIKSYSDYRYIDSRDICYFKADNNSTDIHLNNGEMVTAFKTLKHFENVLPHPFARIHNSYIVNRNYVSRIHTGNSVCYIKNTNTKLPFSRSYKENIEHIISYFTNGNYLEI